MRTIAVLMALLLCVPVVVAGNDEAFWEAARQGDLETMKRLKAEGVDIDARSRYGATALSFDCD